MEETTFSELRAKTVVNVVDGKKLGHICDISFTLKGKLIGLILPSNKKLLNTKSGEMIFVPYENILKIGTDTILVEMC